jgi:NIMA (never in mitosis gene a)-related kinase 1/4/5
MQETLMRLQDVLWATKYLRQVVLVSDYMVHGSLADHLHIAGMAAIFLNEEICQSVSYQLLLALDFLHFKRVMHRDVKPQNVLIAKWSDDFLRVKLSNFGIAKLITCTEQGTSKVGSKGFIAPEVEFRDPQDDPYTFKADIWSFGATMMKW